MVWWLTYQKRHSYATKSNQTRVVKTPGGKLVYQYTKKRASGPKCPVTGKKIQGVVSSCPFSRPAFLFFVLSLLANNYTVTIDKHMSEFSYEDFSI
ncbi:hypothetical protein ACJX0J_029625, partial [Zea mays]